MSLGRKLLVLTLRPLAEGACHVLGGEAAGAACKATLDLLAGRLGDDSQRLLKALESAHQRAWKVLEIALAGDSFWDRCKAAVARGEDRAFRDQVRLFLERIPAGQLPADRAAFSRQCLQELRAARKAGLLEVGVLDRGRLAEEAQVFGAFDDPQRVLRGERQLAEGMADRLAEAGHVGLARLLTAGEGPSLLVLASRYFFRRAVEEDEKLSRGLMSAQLDGLQKGQEQGFAALQRLLTQDALRVEEALAEVHVLLTETHTAVLDIQRELAEHGEQNKALYDAVLALQKRFDLMHATVRPRDSLSIRTEAERRLVKELIARYRALPDGRRRELPALLNAVGKLEVAVGSFQSAQHDFAAVAGLVNDPGIRAEAHHNAYRAALESRDWAQAMRELLQTVRLDGKRFAPFPVGKYPPQRILGAGGFGVAFLCRHKYMDIPVVVKTLLNDELDRGIEQLFAEAHALRQLNHPGIVQVQDCGYTDPASRSRPYLVMDFFDGVNLADHLAAHGPLEADALLPLARQVAEALAAAHAKGILHRDVKPHNLLVQGEGKHLRAQLIDFGLALRISALAASTRRSGTLVGASLAGTLEYAAPEQLGRLPGCAVGPASDIYGFARTCCFALFETTQPVLRHWQAIPESLADLLGQCLAEDPAERPQDFEAVIARLDGLGSARRTAVKVGERKIPTVVPDDNRPQVVRRRVVRRWEEDEEEGQRRKKKGQGAALMAQLKALPVWFWVVGGVGTVCLLMLLVLGLGLILRRPVRNPADVLPGPNWTPPRTSLADIIPGPSEPPAAPPWAPDATTKATWENPPLVSGPVRREGKIVYLTDIKEADQKGGFAPVGKNGKRSRFGEAAQVSGRPTPKALSMCPFPTVDSSMTYNLGDKATAFQAWVAVDDRSGNPPVGATYTVLGDGKELWKSTTVTKGYPEPCLVDLRGVQVLQVRVSGRSPFDAVWIDPCIWVKDR